MNKYDPLERLLEGVQPTVNEKSLSFSDIERVLGFRLPNSAYEHRAWWSNPSSPSDHPHAQSWLKAGWIVDSVDQLEKRVHFRRFHSRIIQKAPPLVTNISPSPNPQNVINNESSSTIRVSDSKRILLDLGFEEIGEWLLKDGLIQFRLTKYGNEQNILYAFLVDGGVKYIGKSNQTLTGRMNGYKNPGPTQSTNIDKKARIEELLHKGVPVQILVFVQKEKMDYRGVPINLAAGLEDNLIARIRPPWNNRM